MFVHLVCDYLKLLDSGRKGFETCSRVMTESQVSVHMYIVLCGSEYRDNCLCVYVCLCVCLYVLMYVCNLCMYVCVCMYVIYFICMCVCMYVCTCMYEFMYACMYVYMYVST